MHTDESYQELLTLTKLYLYQEYQKSDWKECSLESLEYYRAFAKTRTPSPVPPAQATLHKNLSQPVTPTIRKKVPPKPLTPPPEPIDKKITRTLPQYEEIADQEFGDLKKTFEKISPHLLAEKRQEKEKEERKPSQGGSKVVFLSLKDHPEHHAFLIKVAVAIVNKGSSAEVLTMEQLDRIQNPQLILGTELLFSKHPGIQERFPQAKIVPLSSLSLYLKNESMKRELWKFLCKELKL